MLGGFAVVFLFCALGIQGAEGTLDIVEGDLMWLLRRVVDPMFSVSTISVSLSRHFTGINVLMRVLMLCAFIVLIRGVYWETQTMSAEFGDYLKEKFEEREKRAETREKKREAELRSAMENTENELTHLEEGAGETAEKTQADEKRSEEGSSKNGADSKRTKTDNKSKIWQVLFGTGGIAGIFGYIFGGNESREAIVDILKAVGRFLDTVTLTAKIMPRASGFKAFLSNFFYVSLSICILAAYVAMAGALVILAATAIRHYSDIIKWVRKRAKAIWTCIGVIALLVLACEVVFVLGPGLGVVQEVFADVFYASSIFELIAKLLLLVLEICAALLVMGVAVVFAILVLLFGYQTVKKGMERLQYHQSILK